MTPARSVSSLQICCLRRRCALRNQRSLHTKASASRGLYRAIEGLRKELRHLQEEEGGLEREG